MMVIFHFPCLIYAKVYLHWVGKGQSMKFCLTTDPNELKMLDEKTIWATETTRNRDDYYVLLENILWAKQLLENCT